MKNQVSVILAYFLYDHDLPKKYFAKIFPTICLNWISYKK